MARYMAITGLDCTIPSLVIDTEAPLDVLHETAAYRISAGTQAPDISCKLWRPK